jgi:hypothetical protein
MKLSNQLAAMDFEMALNGLPPSIIALQCVTDHQKARMATMLEHFQDIAVDVAAYFGGQESPFNRETSHGGLIGAETAYYISLYNLLFFGWDALKLAARKDWGTLGPVLSIYQSTPFPQCPGDALKLAITLDFESAMQVALDGGSISVEQSRRILRGKGSTLPGSYGGDHLEVAPAFNGWVVDAIKNRLNGRPDLRSHLKDYQHKLKARNKTINRLLRAGVRGERWRDGQRVLN